jgi:hypothetical protein
MTHDFETLAAELRERLEPLVAALLRTLEAQDGPLLADSSFAPEEIGAFARRSMRVELRSFSRGVLPERPADLDVAMVRTAASGGGLRLLLNGYWAAQQVLSTAWLDLVETAAPPPRRPELLRRIEYFFLYGRLHTDLVAEAYRREVQRAARGPDAERLQVVRSLLEGDPLPAAAAGFAAEHHHLGLIAWGAAGEEAARDLGAALGRPVLLVGPLNGEWWGWVSGARPLSRADEIALERHRPPSGAGLAVGLPAFGIDGFRGTHRQARRARWRARAAGGFHPYADVAVESLAAENEEDARAFLAHELRGINDDSAISRRIRETLLAYFAAGQNAASAAVALGVHQQTVANRLRTAEERLGAPIGSRRLELELALRLRSALASEDS